MVAALPASKELFFPEPLVVSLSSGRAARMMNCEGCSPRRRAPGCVLGQQHGKPLQKVLPEICCCTPRARERHQASSPSGTMKSGMGWTNHGWIFSASVIVAATTSLLCVMPCQRATAEHPSGAPVDTSADAPPLAAAAESGGEQIKLRGQRGAQAGASSAPEKAGGPEAIVDEASIADLTRKFIDSDLQPQRLRQPVINATVTPNLVEKLVESNGVTQDYLDVSLKSDALSSELLQLLIGRDFISFKLPEWSLENGAVTAQHIQWVLDGLLLTAEFVDRLVEKREGNALLQRALMRSRVVTAAHIQRLLKNGLLKPDLVEQLAANGPATLAHFEELLKGVGVWTELLQGLLDRGIVSLGQLSQLLGAHALSAEGLERLVGSGGATTITDLKSLVSQDSFKPSVLEQLLGSGVVPARDLQQVLERGALAEKLLRQLRQSVAIPAAFFRPLMQNSALTPDLEVSGSSSPPTREALNQVLEGLSAAAEVVAHILKAGGVITPDPLQIALQRYVSLGDVLEHLVRVGVLTLDDLGQLLKRAAIDLPLFLSLVQRGELTSAEVGALQENDLATRERLQEWWPGGGIPPALVQQLVQSGMTVPEFLLRLLRSGETTAEDTSASLTRESLAPALTQLSHENGAVNWKFFKTLIDEGELDPQLITLLEDKNVTAPDQMRQDLPNAMNVSELHWLKEKGLVTKQLLQLALESGLVAPDYLKALGDNQFVAPGVVEELLEKDSAALAAV